MVNFLFASYFWWVVWEILVYSEVEGESAMLVHALVWRDGQGKVENVVRIREFGAHGAAKRKLREIYLEIIFSSLLKLFTRCHLRMPVDNISYLFGPVVAPL